MINSKSHSNFLKVTPIQQEEKEDEGLFVNTQNTIFQNLKIKNKLCKEIGRESLDENINYFTNKVEELSFLYESKETRALYQKLQREKWERKNKKDKPKPASSSTSMDFNRTVIKKLMNNTDQENRYMIDAMMSGRIASMSIPSNFRTNISTAPNKGAGKKKENNLQLPFKHINKNNLISYKRKEEMLKKNLFKFKESEIFKFRLKYRTNKENNNSIKSNEFSQNNQTTEFSTGNNLTNTNNNEKSLHKITSHNPIPNRTGKNILNNTQSKFNSTKSSFFSQSQAKIKPLEENCKLNNIFSTCKKSESKTKNLQNKIKKNANSFSKSLDKVRFDKNDHIETQMMKTALKEKKKKGAFIYGDGVDSEGKYIRNKEDVKDSFKIISNLKSEDAFKIKEILTQKFSIQHTPDELLYKRKLKINEDNSPVDKFEKVTNLIEHLDKKKKSILKRLNCKKIEMKHN